MTYNLASRFDYVGQRMKELNQNTLSLSRVGESDIVVNNFTPEKIDVETLAAYGLVQVTKKMQAFVFDTSSYSSWSESFPKVGDTITWNNRTYNVMVMGKDDEVYTFTTSSRLRIRVNTKQIG